MGLIISPPESFQPKVKEKRKIEPNNGYKKKCNDKFVTKTAKLG